MQQQWGKLTDDDLDVIRGKRKELAGQSRLATARRKTRPRPKSTAGCHATDRPTSTATARRSSGGLFLVALAVRYACGKTSWPNSRAETLAFCAEAGNSWRVTRSTGCGQPGELELSRNRSGSAGGATSPRCALRKPIRSRTGVNESEGTRRPAHHGMTDEPAQGPKRGSRSVKHDIFRYVWFASAWRRTSVP